MIWAARPSPSLRRPSRMCSVPMKSCRSASASRNDSSRVFFARGVNGMCLPGSFLPVPTMAVISCRTPSSVMPWPSRTRNATPPRLFLRQDDDVPCVVGESLKHGISLPSGDNLVNTMLLIWSTGESGGTKGWSGRELVMDWEDRLDEWELELELNAQLEGSDWVTLERAASETGVSRAALRTWYRTEQIPSRLVDGPHGPQRLVPLAMVAER